MSKVEADISSGAVPRSSNGWRELWLKEDWWAVWLGLAIVIIGLALFAHGGSWRWVAVVPPRWTSFAQLGGHFADNWLRYLVQFVLWAAAFSVALGALGHKPREFLPAFVFLYILSVAVFACQHSPVPSLPSALSGSRLSCYSRFPFPGYFLAHSSLPRLLAFEGRKICKSSRGG